MWNVFKKSINPSENFKTSITYLKLGDPETLFTKIASHFIFPYLKYKVLINNNILFWEQHCLLFLLQDVGIWSAQTCMSVSWVISHWCTHVLI